MLCSSGGTHADATPSDKRAAAEINGEVITWDTVNQSLADRQYPIDFQAYELQKNRLDELIDERLVASAGGKEGIAPEEYLKRKIEAKKTAVTDEEVHAFFEERKGQLKGNEADWALRIRTYLEQQRESQIRKELLEALRKEASVKVFLKEPQAPRHIIDIAARPVKGPAEAPVTVVEFSDFQCPYCSRAEETIGQILKMYPDRVRLVYRNFPLSAIHPNAQAAAEAAECAYQSGKYWEYHDLLFQHQDKLAREDLGQYAEKAGIDSKIFSACLDGGKGKDAVEKDKLDAGRNGVTGTPTFFINGKRISGAVPLDVLKKTIDDELASRSPKT